MSASSDRWAWARVVATVVLLIVAGAYLAVFFRVPLQNNPKDEDQRPITRWRLAREAVGPSLLSTVDRLTHAGDSPAQQIQIGERPWLVLRAALLLGAALGFGMALMRWLKLDAALTSLELGVFAWGTGLLVQSLMTLGLGLVGCLYQGIFLALTLVGWVLLGLTGLPWLKRCGTRAIQVMQEARWWAIPAGVLVGCFLLLALLGALSPPVDFDVLEYHLGGPKEFYTAGRIRFLPHNVYTSFPFSVEMLLLSGMAIHGTVLTGALVGKVLVGTYGVLTALTLWALGRRYLPRGAGAVAALVYLTTPWVYRISIIAYVEGALSFHVVGTVLAFCIASDHARRTGSRRVFLLAGAMAGGAVCCKYTGAAFVAVPVAVLVLWHRRLWARTGWGVDLRALVLYAAAGVAMAGPWFLKNAVATGNPTYPLLYRVFDGRHWDAQRDARWVRGHRADHFTLAEAGRNVTDFALRSDWANALLFVFLPGSLILAWRHGIIRLLWVYAATYALVYFLFTHRIDRFYVPVLPVFAALSGAGVCVLRGRVWKIACGAVVALVGVFNLGLCTTGLAGYNALLYPIDKQTETIVARYNTAAYWVNSRLPRDAVVLLVGEARPFYFNRAILYNTVFDTNRFACLARGRTPAEVTHALRRRHITHVLVNWSEVERYRGSYGFDPFVRRDLFAGYVRAGVLRALLPTGLTADRIGSSDAPLELYEVVGPGGGRDPWGASPASASGPTSRPVASGVD